MPFPSFLRLSHPCLQDTIASLETELQQIEDTLFAATKKLPNWSHPEARIPYLIIVVVVFSCWSFQAPKRGEPPKVLKLVGNKPTFDGFSPKSHLELGHDLDILHF